MEEWKVCFEDYEISNFGNCRRKKKNGQYLTINGSISNVGGGYKYFQVQREGKRINKLFHHLVAEQFIGERPDGLVIDHIDRNSLNNNVNNLRYITQHENMRNQYRYKTEITELDTKKRKIVLDKKYRQDNIELIKLKKKQYYENNKTKLLEKQRIYRLQKKGLW